MNSPAIRIELLAAGYGDCLLVECPVPGGSWRLLVDTGPDECWPALRERLGAVPRDTSGVRNIDLALITHIDHDHIGAARALFSDNTLGLRFGDIWFNARRHLGARGVGEGETLAQVLGEAAGEVPWNRAFAGEAVATAAGSFHEITTVAGGPRITLLSPTPAQLARLATTWDRELARLRRGQSEPVPRAARGTGPTFPDLEALAAVNSPVDASRANGSSIALLLEHRGASVLLGADAYASVLVASLGALAAARGQSRPLQIDAFKLAHHGSRGNLTRALLEAVRARHYLVSTNNAVFGLPDDEALARTVLHGGTAPTLWFNYATPANRRWADPALQARFHFNAMFPAQGNAGIRLDLPGRSD